MQLNFNIAAMKIKYHTFSETGPRRKNEDYLRILEFPRLNGLMAVLCDGMGGHNTGDVASKLVAESLCTFSVGFIFRSTCCKKDILGFRLPDKTVCLRAGSPSQ